MTPTNHFVGSNHLACVAVCTMGFDVIFASRTLDLSLTELRQKIAAHPSALALDSGDGFGETGRYSLFALAPSAIFSAWQHDWQLVGSKALVRPSADSSSLVAFEQLRRQTQSPPRHHELPFQGGWIGFAGYDLAPMLERLPRRHGNHKKTGARDSAKATPAETSLEQHDRARIPDLWFAYVDTFIVWDRITKSAVAYSVADQSREQRLDELVDSLHQTSPLVDAGGALVSREPVSDLTRAEYLSAIARVIEYIKAGDIFQANFTHRFSAPFVGEPGQVYLRCVNRSQAPFGAYLRSEQWSVISNSPERFLLVEPTGRVETRPIKGTRPRGRTPFHDLMLMAELTDSEKDLAELAMIVDLERNDLGRVCEFGSVRVREHARSHSYANVHHLISIVEGQLKPNVSLEDLLRATFPGGSITGAPKIRAMEIIDELEPVNRGVYTGAIGYMSNHGRIDWNIAIRTAIVEANTVHYHVGGGIVVDSLPEAEYAETLTKGQRLHDILMGQ